MIDLTKEEDHNDILNRCGDTPNYGMELDSDEVLLKGEELEWSCTPGNIPRGAKHQGKLQGLAHTEINAELSELHKDCMAHVVSHRINNPALKELEEATWVSYHLHWEDFGHALDKRGGLLGHMDTELNQVYWVNNVLYSVQVEKSIYLSVDPQYIWDHHYIMAVYVPYRCIYLHYSTALPKGVLHIYQYITVSAYGTYSAQAGQRWGDIPQVVAVVPHCG
jgi:hypothetical protein